MNPMDIWLHLDTIDQQKVEQLRQLVYEYAESHQEEIDLNEVRHRIVSPQDVQNGVVPDLAVKDWFLKRCLISAKVAFDPQSALSRWIEIFHFRTQWRVSRLTLENTLPAEFFKVVPFVADGVDRKGYKLMITRFKFYRKIPQFDILIKQAMVYLVEQEDIMYEKYANFNGVTLLMDFQDFNYLHSNVEMLNFMVQLGFKYPGNIRSILIYSLPWPLKFLVRMAEKLVDTFAGSKLITFHSIDKNNIHDFIDANQLPHFLQGTRPIKTEIPKSVVPLLELIKATNVIEEKNAIKIHDYVVKELL